MLSAESTLKVAMQVFADLDDLSESNPTVMMTVLQIINSLIMQRMQEEQNGSAVSH
jgi:hypothetical protein